MAKRLYGEETAADDIKLARREAKRLRKEKAIHRDVNGSETAVTHEGVVGDKIANGARGITDGDAKHLMERKTKMSKAERNAPHKVRKERMKVKPSLDEVESVYEDVGDVEAVSKAGQRIHKFPLKVAQNAAGADGVSKRPTGDSMRSSGALGQHGTIHNPYKEDEALAALPLPEIEKFVAETHLAIDDPQNQPYRPILAFKYLPVEERLKTPFANFAAPTPVQAACWPYLLAGRDVIGVAETGSGKTLAFGVPCVRHISGLELRFRKVIKACIISPTRELALQIYEQLNTLAEPIRLKVTCVYGGTSKDAQRETLRGAQIVVATPGRLNDFIEERSIDLSEVDYLVLDEADRMWDKGFEQDVRKIISTTPSDGRQTLMFTATWPQSVRDLAHMFMERPVKIMIGDSASGELRANTRITQEVQVIQQSEKYARLIQLLRQYQSGKRKNDRILVFCLYKKEATRIEDFIRKKGFIVAGIHGDLSQPKRTESLEAFKRGNVPLLVATDVAARGLDIPAVKLVINVTFPLTVEDYVHRIGRTARAGQDGKAITLFTDAEKGLSGALINVLKAANQPVPDELMKFGTTVKKKGHEAYGAFFKETDGMPKARKITFD